MNIYKVPNLIISPKQGGGERGHSAMNPSTHTHLTQCQEEKATGTGKDASLEQI